MFTTRGVADTPPTERRSRSLSDAEGPAEETGLGDSFDRSEPACALWVDSQVAAHKQPGYAIVNISLKPRGGIPGDASAEQIALVADLAEQYSLDELRVTHAQNLVLPHVKKADLHAIWQKLRSEEHTSELQSLMRISYAVFCLKKKTQQKYKTIRIPKL